jgi:hypothetical protein
MPGQPVRTILIGQIKQTGEIMRTFVMAFIVAAGVVGLAAPTRAMPTIPHYLSDASSTITEVLQHCGKGYHREKGWQDKQGAYHGNCVARPAKKTSPS